MSTTPESEDDKDVANYTEGIRLNPKDADGYINRGNVYYRKGESDKAIADFTETIRLDPQNALAYFDRGVVFYNKGDYDKAIADLTEAIRLDPKYANSYVTRGCAYDSKGQYDKGIADYTEAIRLDPKNALACFNRGNAYQHKGDYDRAIADFTEAIRLNPTDTDSYVNRALAYDQKGESHKAKADRNQVRRLNLTSLASLPFLLGTIAWALVSTAWGLVSLPLVAGSTFAFLAFSISLTNTSSVSDLIGSIVAAVTFVAAARAVFAYYGDSTVFTVISVLFFSLIALGFGFICSGESIRVTLWGSGALGLLGDGYYFVRYIRDRRVTASLQAEQKNCPTERLAIWSIVLSVLGLLFFPVARGHLAACGGIPLVAGVICGHLALPKFRVRPDLPGRSNAIAGLVVGYLGIGTWLLWVVVSFPR